MWRSRYTDRLSTPVKTSLLFLCNGHTWHDKRKQYSSFYHTFFRHSNLTLHRLHCVGTFNSIIQEYIKDIGWSGQVGFVKRINKIAFFQEMRVGLAVRSLRQRQLIVFAKPSQANPSSKLREARLPDGDVKGRSPRRLKLNDSRHI